MGEIKSLSDNLKDFLPILPEIFITIWAGVILALDLIVGQNFTRKGLGLLAAGGMLIGLVLALLLAPAANASSSIFGGMIRHDLFASAFKIIFIAGGLFTCLASVDFRAARAGGEYYALIMFSSMAMCLMSASSDIIMLYLATETASIAQYLLAGFQRGSKLSAEAGIKYFVFGAVTSTVMLYGLSLLYGMSGGTSYNTIADTLTNGNVALRVPMTLAMLMVMVGFAFKTSAVPFHFWAPDVYQGAPTPIAGFISTASKAAGFAIMMRFLYVAIPPGVAGTGVWQVSGAWSTVILSIAFMTMLAGNLLAIGQTNVKRMMAYSSIAQAGYLLIGVAAFAAAVTKEARADAIASVIFYVATYMLTNIAAFTVIGLVSQKVGGDDYKHFAGLSRRSPYLALGMVAAMLSLLGAPPMVGFVGKLFLFRSAIGVGAATSDIRYYMLVVIGILGVLMSCWYYLGVVKAMYVDRSADEAQQIRIPASSGFVLTATTIGALVLTAISTPFWDIALNAAKSFLIVN